ncbi:HAMP domain protein (plasmid) [Nitratidesulfovibrio vulgaris str. Hildenborough]|uniref:HAMP domain protein n=2 Tax=Nitratidesulfovibrio vulgaris TaxID=881 RepID=Q72WJ0_NITV2|nr:HAMP domain protein [Nitratidesulfovibrio vulgaris str. Hildenborough]
MPAMTISLRTKLFLLVACSIALATVPIISFTYRDLRQSNAELEREAFGNVITLMEDGIDSRYLNLLSNKVVDVLLRKEQLRRFTQLARATWQDVAQMPPDVRERFVANWIGRLAEFGVHMDIVDAQGRPRAGTGLLGTVLADPSRTDFKGRPVRSLLSPVLLPQDGEFAVLEASGGASAVGASVASGTAAAPGAAIVDGLPLATAQGDTASSVPTGVQADAQADAQTPAPVASAATPATGTAVAPSGAPMLVYFLPMPDGESVAVSALLLSDIEKQALFSEQQIIRSLQEKFATLKLSGSGYIALLSGRGEVLAHEGNPLGRSDGTIPADALATARAQGRVEVVSAASSPLGQAIFRIAYFKALDWYVVSAAPVAEIEAPTNALVRKLSFLAAIAVLVSLAATLGITARLIAPLRMLTRKAHALSSLDFSAPDAATFAAEGLFTRRSDEVGQLARAFAFMGEALSRNVRALMETTAAKERIQGELDAARDIQMGILPAPDACPVRPGFSAHAFLEPAKEVGGDLYDFLTAPDGRQVFVIGDVSGKGVPAALFMAMVVTLCRYAVAQGLSPAEAMMRVNAQLAQNNPGCMFVTLFIAAFDPQTGVLEYANGGHCQPCVVDCEGTAPPFELEGISGPMVGAFEDVDYEGFTATLEEGQTCLVYTDGVTEAMNPALELFDMVRLHDVVAAHRASTPADMLTGVHEALLAFRGEAEQSDDITMLSFTRRKP